jgi:hypothetical protein
MSVKIDLNRKIHVLTKKEGLDGVHPRQSGGGARYSLRHHDDGHGARARRAGYFVERFAGLLGAAADLSDAAKAARGLREEVEFACRFDALPVVPALEQGRLRLVSGSARSRSG